MAVYHISYYLYRSNPVILREIKIPAECTVQDLCATFCLAMGISVARGKIFNDMDQEMKNKKRLSEVFDAGDDRTPVTGRFVIFQDNQMKEITSLTFFFEVLEETDETIPSPDIVKGIGNHLPQGVFRIGMVNEILGELEERESFTLAGAGTFYNAQQTFQLKKTHNLIYSWFMPDMVSTLKTEFAVPLTAVLENKTVAELKRLVECHHVYVYNSRKADYVAALNHKLCENDPKLVFQEMSSREYLNFRELVLNGTIPCADNEKLLKEFPVLYYYGMMSFSKKQGVLLASALIQDYEEWFDQEKEIQFRMGKRIASVMNGCRIYYGIFTRDMCHEVLEAMYPGEIPQATFEQFWETPFLSAGLTGIEFTDGLGVPVPIAYDDNLFNEKELPLYLKVLAKDGTRRYLPEKEMFERISQNGILEMVPAYGKLFLFLRNYTYGEDERWELCFLGIDYLRKGYSAAEASKRVVSYFHYFWGDKERVQRELEEILYTMLADVPNILYYGYTLKEAKEKHVVSKAVPELNRLIKEAQEEERRKKEEAAARKAAARKKAAASGTGKRGKKS